MDYWIGIDMGTTATKAVLYTGSGTIVATQSIAYTLYRDPSGMAEEAPEEVTTELRHFLLHENP